MENGCDLCKAQNVGKKEREFEKIGSRDLKQFEEVHITPL